MPADIDNPHDRFFKEVWSRKAVGRDFLRHYLPAEVVALLDLRSLELAKESFVDEHLREHYSDMLYRVQFKDGSAGFVYVLLEHKRTPERFTAFQLLRYLVRIWEQALAQGKQQLPPIIPLVVYHGDKPWPHGQSLQEALRMPAQLARYAPDFRYALCDLTGLVEADIRGAVWLRVALLMMKYIGDPELAERLPGILGLLRELGQKRTALGYLETLLRYLAMVAKTVTEDELRRAIGVALPTLEKNVMETLAQKWLEQGRQEGRQEGEVLVLLRLLERRFGPLSDRNRWRLREADADTLLAWSERVLTASSIEEVLKR